MFNHESFKNRRAFTCVPKASTSKHLYENIIDHEIDYQNEVSIEVAASMDSKDEPLDLVIVATGIIHDGKIIPEKLLEVLDHLTPKSSGECFVWDGKEVDRCILSGLSAIYEFTKKLSKIIKIRENYFYD